MRRKGVSGGSVLMTMLWGIYSEEKKAFVAANVYRYVSIETRY